MPKLSFKLRSLTLGTVRLNKNFDPCPVPYQWSLVDYFLGLSPFDVQVISRFMRSQWYSV